MLSTAAARSTARNARLAAARDYATEIVQNVELQDNLGLEDKILGNLSAIVVEAIDCVRSDQPFRSSSLSMLSLELLSYLRQANKPMLVNFACAFTMLMSELEGLDLTERAEGGTRSYSNSIPDVPPEASTSTSTNVCTASFSSPATASRSSRPPQPTQPLPQASGGRSSLPQPLPQALPRPPPPSQDFLQGLLKEELLFTGREESRPSVEPIDYDELDHSEKVEDFSLDGDTREDGKSESSYIDDSGDQSELLQRMIANFSAPSTSTSANDSAARSAVARSQPKSKTGRFESRDDELAATFELPVSAAEIETMPDHAMARLLRSGELTEQQRLIMRQIRKRARSKISSREYRRRKEAKRLEESVNSSHQAPK